MVKIDENVELKNSLKGDGTSDQSLNRNESEASAKISVSQEGKKESMVRSSLRVKFGSTRRSTIARRSVSFMQPAAKSRLSLVQKSMVQFQRSTGYLVALVVLTLLYLTNIISHFVLIELYKEHRQNKDPNYQDILDYMKLFDTFNLVLCICFGLDVLFAFISKPKHLKNIMKWLEAIQLVWLIIFELDTLKLINLFSMQTHSIKLVAHMIRMFFMVVWLQHLYDNRLFQSKRKIKTNIMQVINYLFEVKTRLVDDDLAQDIRWSIKMIKSNRLFDTDMLRSENNQEQIKFLDQYNVSKQKSKSNVQPRHSIINARQYDSLEGKKIFGKTIKKVDAQQRLRYAESTIMFKNVPIKATEYLDQHADQFSFNTFLFDELSDGMSLVYFVQFVFEKEQFCSEFSIKDEYVFDVAQKIQENYINPAQVPYHNRLHALDVAQTLYTLLKTCKLEKFAIESPLQKMGCVLAACAHDMNHPGLSNIFCINSGHPLAVTYNDQSVLENFHASQLFSLILTQDSLFMRCLSREQQDQLRTLIIKYILATDMAFHFQKIGKVNAIFAGQSREAISSEDKQLCVELCLHAADISNPLKKIEVYSRWVDLLMVEFFSIGDKERDLGLPISLLCDRHTVNVGKSQVGFIDFIVRPIFDSIAQFLPEVKQPMKQLENNKAFYKEKQEEKERLDSQANQQP